MRRITSRFVLLIATAAILPLATYGAVSINSLQKGTGTSVREGNLKVATQVAEQVSMYMQHNTRVLQSVGAELGSTGLSAWQQDRLLKDYVLQFPEFREITVFDAAARPLATSALGTTRLTIPEAAERRQEKPYIAPLKFDDDLLPTTTIAVRLRASQQEASWVVGEIALEELWRMVDRIRVGHEGYALIVGEDMRLIAHGNPDERRHIADTDQTRAKAELDFAGHYRLNPTLSSTQYVENGRPMLAVAAALPQNDPPWLVIVEQPESEAMATANRIQKQLLAAIVLALLGTIILGYLWGRTFIQRIFALTRVTRSIADGKLETRVALSGHDEIRELGDAFNSMADRLVELQEDIRKQERQVMFGRIAAGLVHDLSHPIQNIGNGCKLIVKMWDDSEYRETFHRMFERELSIVKRVLEDLQNIAKPIPLEHFPLEVNRTVAEAIESMQPLAETAGVTLRAEVAADPLYIEGDLFALARVYRNLVVNAIQATAPGGLVVAATEGRGESVQIRVYDTGCGIPADRLQAVFEDFVTTKRRGLGLGLAITRKIVEQLGGRITVASEVGKGTTFVMEFPRTSARPMAQAAG
ncbi:MAG TPA: sensor histidine kinase [Vicinamibacterales bacterium]|nr:sensor histidine kinase [Vicinamibacterales bacterium]